MSHPSHMHSHWDFLSDPGLSFPGCFLQRAAQFEEELLLPCSAPKCYKALAWVSIPSSSASALRAYCLLTTCSGTTLHTLCSKKVVLSSCQEAACLHCKQTEATRSVHLKGGLPFFCMCVICICLASLVSLFLLRARTTLEPPCMAIQ